MSESANHYRTLAGRVYDFATLEAEDRLFLERVLSLYEAGTPWAKLNSAWLSMGRKTIWKNKDIPVGGAVYRICQDLVSRRGIQEGRVARPDYREKIADLIERRFRSRYEFCKKTGVDQGHLSRVLAGKRHLAPETFFRIIEALGIEIRLVERDESEEKRCEQERRAHALERLKELQTDMDALAELAARIPYTPPEQHNLLLRSPGFFPTIHDRVRERVSNGEDLVTIIEDERRRAFSERERLNRELASGEEAKTAWS